jgi:hypothetical protein
MEWVGKRVTLEEFPYEQAKAIKTISETKDRNFCIVLGIVEGAIHGYVAANKEPCEFPPVNDTIWHIFGSPKEVVYRNTNGVRVEQGAKIVNLIDCTDEEIALPPSVKTLTIENSSPIKLRIDIKQ